MSKDELQKRILEMSLGDLLDALQQESERRIKEESFNERRFIQEIIDMIKIEILERV